MSRNLRNAIRWLNDAATGVLSPTPGTPAPGAATPGASPTPAAPTPAPPPPPTPPARRPTPAPDAPTPATPTPTPSAPSRLPTLGRAAQIAAAVVAGGYGLGNLLNGLGGGDDPQPQPAAQPAGPPAPPPPPPVDPKTATREEMLAAGYRDYGGGWVNAGAGAPQPRTNGMGVPDHWRKKMFLDEQNNRYRQEFAKTPAMYNDMVASYDQGGPSHASRAFATRALTDHLGRQKAAQIGINVDNQAKQNNVARQMGMTRGQVMAMEDVSASAASGDLAGASAKAAMYAEQYGPAFLYAARNMTDQHMASEKAKAEIAGQKPTPPTAVESVEKGMKDIASMPPGATRRAAIETLHTQRNNGDPAAAKKAVENHYQPIVREMATRLDRLSPDELSELQQVAGGMSYQQFMQYSGLPDTVDNQKHFQRIFGKNASYAQFGDNLGFGIGNAIRGLTPWAD